MHPRLVQLFALLLCGGLVFGASRFAPPINAGREDMNAFGAEEAVESTPPEYAFAIQAFGAFRSLVTNIAFIRAETLKEEGRYFDAMQLASWICKLQPRFPSVWSFHAWNMAWNISVTTFTPQERWNWVYNGARLLRDDGIRFNPRALNLYKQLAWIYNNKMGEMLDDHHINYKRQWAWRMHLLFGPRLTTLREFRPGQEFEPVLIDVAEDPLVEASRAIARRNEQLRAQQREEENRPFKTTETLEERLETIPWEVPEELSDTETQIATRAVYDEMLEIVEAAPTLTALHARHPATRDMVSALRELGVVITADELTEDAYWFEGKLAETFFWRYRQLADDPTLRSELRADADPAEQDETLARFDEIVGVTRGDPAGEALFRFLQRKVLREAYKLDPEHMAYVVRHFGPVDWRNVDAHAIYWVSLGLIRGGATPTSFDTDRVNTARILFFGLRGLFYTNRMTFEPAPEDIYTSYINFNRDANFIDAMHRAYITYGPMIDPDPGNLGGAGETFRGGHVNFLHEAIRMLYFAGRIDEAEYYYAYLRNNYSIRWYTDEVNLSYTLPLRDFVLRSLYGEIDSYRETYAIVQDLLRRAYDELADENIDAYNGFVQKAAELHAVYMEEKKKFRGPRLKLPPFQHFQIDTFREQLAMPAYNPNVTIRKVRLWRVAPLNLKQWAYDDLYPYLARECSTWEFDPQRAFPEPPGMVAFRAARPEREALIIEDETATPAQAPK